MTIVATWPMSARVAQNIITVFTQFWEKQLETLLNISKGYINEFLHVNVVWP